MKNLIKILGLLLVVALFIGTIFFLWGTTREEVVSYDLVVPQTETITTSTVATGNILPRDEIEVKPQISGIISEVRCEAGDMVREGDILAQVKVIPEMGQLNSAESRVNQAKISLEQKSRSYERVKRLFDNGVATLEEYEEASDYHKLAIEEMENARRNLEIVMEGAVRGSKNLSNTQIRATITGMVLDVPIKVGNSVIQANTFNDGTTIAKIADLNDMLFVGDLDESEIGKISIGCNSIITIAAVQGVELQGSIEYISPMSQNKNGVVVFPIKASIEIPDSVVLRAGYSANAEMITEQAENVLTIPERFVSFQQGKAYVEIFTTLKEGAQIFEQREVTLGLSNGVIIEVKSGITLDDKIKGAEIKEYK